MLTTLRAGHSAAYLASRVVSRVETRRQHSMRNVNADGRGSVALTRHLGGSVSNTRTTHAVRVPRRIGVLLAVFAALFAVFLMTAPPASAAVGDEDDPYRISG